MWFIGGSKTRMRKVKDGRTGQRLCEECKEVTVFHEQDVTDKVNAFFVELFAFTQRRMVCSECGEDHDVEEFFTAVTTTPARPMPAHLQPAKLVQPARRAEPAKKSDEDVDEMLAALKRKLGK